MGYYLAVPILALLAALQSSIVPQFRLYSGQPNLILIFVLAWAVHAELEEGLLWAILGSIFSDLLSIVPLGTSALAPVAAIFVIDLFRRNLFRINLIFLAVLVHAATALQQVIVWLVLWSRGYGVSLGDGIQYVLIPTLLMNILLFFPFYLIVRIIQRSTTRRRSAFGS